jgi:hypothetical protein
VGINNGLPTYVHYGMLDKKCSIKEQLPFACNGFHAHAREDHAYTNPI